MRSNTLVATAVIASILSGCASTPRSFAENKYQLNDTQVCRTAFAADAQEWSAKDTDEVRYEVQRRRLDKAQCDALVSQQNTNIATGVVAVAGIALLAAAVARSGGGGSTPDYYQRPTARAPEPRYEPDSAWDRFRDGSWHCRARHGGQLVHNSNCVGKAKFDNWP
jgi:hypothetical protein